MDYLPLFVQLRAQPVVVVGGGRIAVRKIELLRKSGARITVISPELREELQRLAASGEIRYIPERFAEAHVEGATIVVAATNDHDVNVAVSTSARARKSPVNVVDNPTLSTFVCPAIVDRSPIIAAVSTGGEAPVLARRVREQIEALLPQRLGALARFMGARRKTVQSTLGVLARRPFWERIVNGIVGTRVLAGDESGAEKAFDTELRTSHLTTSPTTGATGLGEVYLIGAGPGDPDLLTLRAMQLLQQADVVLYDRLVPDAVLERSRRDAERVFVGKDAGDHTVQDRINQLLVEYARRGLRVARLKGGDPFIFGRGGEEVEHLRAAGVHVEILNGITSGLAAATSLGVPLTHRKHAQGVIFLTGHAQKDADAPDWKSLAATARGARLTLVIYMGVSTAARIQQDLLTGLPAATPVAVVQRASLPDQRHAVTTLGELAATIEREGLASPSVIVVGDVVQGVAAAGVAVGQARAA